MTAMGPVFVSYRQSDGSATASSLAWLLRAAGVPVWQDQTDLPPGDTESRLEEALGASASDACLMVTADIALSSVVRAVELPRLLVLARDPDFSFVVANMLRTDGRLDYGAPDRLLGQPGTLASLKQYPADERAGLIQVTAELLDARAARLQRRRQDDTGPLRISIETRLRPESQPVDGADLPLRLRPAAHGRLPDPDGLADLQDALRLLPRAFARCGASEVAVSGHAHLSVAFALGAALPATLLPALTVVGTDRRVWSGEPVEVRTDTPLTRRGAHGMGPVKPPGVARDVLAYVDLVPDDPSDAAFARLLGERAFDAYEQIHAFADTRLDPAAAGPLVEEIAGRLRKLVQLHEHARLHLLLRCPFPVAVLLGRLCNTLRVVVYEWDDTERPGDPDARPRYVPALQVQPSQAHGPITEVLLEAPAHAEPTTPSPAGPAGPRSSSRPPTGSTP